MWSAIANIDQSLLKNMGTCRAECGPRKSIYRFSGWHTFLDGYAPPEVLAAATADDGDDSEDDHDSDSDGNSEHSQEDGSDSGGPWVQFVSLFMKDQEVAELNTFFGLVHSWSRRLHEAN